MPVCVIIPKRPLHSIGTRSFSLIETVRGEGVPLGRVELKLIWETLTNLYVLMCGTGSIFRD